MVLDRVADRPGAVRHVSVVAERGAEGLDTVMVTRDDVEGRGGSPERMSRQSA